MHLTIAAREAEDRDLLALVVTGAYPTERVKRLVHRLHMSDKGRVARLLERDERLPAAKLRPQLLPELLDELARAAARWRPIGPLYPALSEKAWRLYGRRAARHLRHAGDARVFHVRAGFGGASIDRARQLGMVVLCDQALAHPSLVGQLVANRGRLPGGAVGEPLRAVPPPPAERLARLSLRDIERADAVLANSHFVRDTFISAGYPADRVYVAYLGIDDNFLEGMEMPRRTVTTGPLQLVFASRFERRKGAEVVIEALEALDEEVEWELAIAGPAAPDIRAAHPGFFNDERVRVLGPLTRPAFKQQMLDRPVFVFPSYAEGSARAVFEALACACYIITTPNAGSIVEDGVHGALVPPGDALALAAAIRAADRDRSMVAEVGNRNAHVVREHYRQVHWGDALARIYEELADTRPTT